MEINEKSIRMFVSLEFRDLEKEGARTGRPPNRLMVSSPASFEAYPSSTLVSV